MSGKQYSHIADIYGHLMSTVDYKDWADYIFEICEGHKLKPQIILELASGTGELAKYLSQLFPKVITTDLSMDMLKRYAAINRNSVCCSMLYIPFRKKFKLILSAFDSINYLTAETEVEKLFREIKTTLSEDGIFTFDVSLEPNSIANQKYLNREGEFKGIKIILI
jgi:SAM-dependent methyltransferase